MSGTISDCDEWDGMEETIIITRSNKQATLLNTGIRNRILYREEELVSGDKLLVAKNNYYWSEEYEEIDFRANGDIATVTRVRGTEKRYGIKFAKVDLEFPDRNVEMEVLVNLDALYSDAPAMSRGQQMKLYNDIMLELEGNQRERYKALKKHPYWNALQVK